MNKSKWLVLFALAALLVFGCRTTDLIGQDLGLVQPTAQAQATTPRQNGVQPPTVPPGVPTQAAATPTVAQPAVAPIPQGCRVIHDYDLNPGMGEVATSGAFLHVEYWTDGQPEREVLLPGGRYKLTAPLKGHVFEYASECNEAQVRAQIDGHISRRRAQGANNAGFVEAASSTGLFRKIGP